MRSTDTFKNELLYLTRNIPMIKHPWFQGIITGKFTKDQIIKGELQHYLRVRRNNEIFGAIVAKASQDLDYEALEISLENYKDEVLGKKTHADLMYQFLEDAKISREHADSVIPTAGSIAAISMLLESTKTMSALESIALMSLPEYQNGGQKGVAAQVYEKLTKHYEFSEYAAETFKVHAYADVHHGEKQILFLARKVEQDNSLKERILQAASFGIVAFNFEWDGHYQAATGNPYAHWCGESNASK